MYLRIRERGGRVHLALIGASHAQASWQTIAGRIATIFHSKERLNLAGFSFHSCGYWRREPPTHWVLQRRSHLIVADVQITEEKGAYLRSMASPINLFGARTGDVFNEERGINLCLGVGYEPSRTRTCDPLVKSQLLYQLSYRPIYMKRARYGVLFLRNCEGILPNTTEIVQVNSFCASLWLLSDS